MNALRTIPTKPLIGARRAAFRLRGSDALLLLALIGGMSMSRGEEGAASEPVAAVASTDNVADNDKAPSVAQPAAVAPTQASTGGDDEKTSASAQPVALSATQGPADVKNDPKVDSDTAGPAAAEAKSGTAARVVVKDANARNRDSSRVLAKLSTAAPVSTASKSDLVSKPEDAKVAKTARNTMAVRPPGMARRASQPGSGATDRSSKSVDAVPVMAGPPPVIYGYGAAARAPYAAASPYATNRQDWMPSAMTGTLERVADAPVAVLTSGKQALYGILDELW